MKRLCSVPLTAAHGLLALIKTGKRVDRHKHHALTDGTVLPAAVIHTVIVDVIPARGLHTRAQHGRILLEPVCKTVGLFHSLAGGYQPAGVAAARRSHDFKCHTVWHMSKGILHPAVIIIHVASNDHVSTLLHNMDWYKELLRQKLTSCPVRITD